ncbi:MAG: hypothetical protein MZU97_27080 [Bacillus subtilis]|nr:hypothetical protein [Bacillus subtilis]
MMARIYRAAMVALLMVLVMAAVSSSAEADASVLGFPPEGWSRETLLCEYSRLTGAFSVDLNGDALCIAYSDGEYDWLKISVKVFKLSQGGPKLLWQKEASTTQTHNITPLVLAAKSGGFHIFWVERPNQDDYSIRYSRIGISGEVEIPDTLLETGAGPIRDLTASETGDGSIALAWSDWRGRTLEVMIGSVGFGEGAPVLSKISYMPSLDAEKAMSTPRMTYIGEGDYLALLWVESGFEEANLILSWLNASDFSVQGLQSLGGYTTASGAYPAISKGVGDEVYVAWPQDINTKSLSATRTSDIMLAYFDGKDLVWSKKVIEMPENQVSPALAFDGQDAFLAWHDFNDRSPHVWVGKPEAGYGPLKVDYNLMASMKPYAGMVGDKAVLVYERFTSEGPRQAYLMSQMDPAKPSLLYSLGIDESAPVKHLAFTLAMAALRSALNVMLNIGALALGMGFLWAMKYIRLTEKMKQRPELMAASIIAFLMLLQATPLFVSLPGIFGPDFHVIVSIVAGLAAFTS